MQRTDGKNGNRLRDEDNIAYGVARVGNKPRVSSSPYLYDIAEGNVTGHVGWSKTGFNGDVDNAEEDMWPYGGLYVFPAAATKMDLVSSSANDDGAPVNTGALTVTIYGLAANYTELSETLTMNGTTPVTTANTYFRINNMRVASVGTNGSPVGNLTLSETGGTTYRYAYIRAGFHRQRQFIYTVPFGKTLYISSMTVSGVNTASGHWCRFTLRANYDEKSDIILATNHFMYFAEYQVVDQSFLRTFCLPMKFPATTTIRMNVVSDASGANEICSCEARGWLE
jgi:hypothetical protein